MSKIFPQMCPGLWYLRNLITSPDYVKSRQTLTCLILVTRDSQPICTFLPWSPPWWCYLCIWILMARVSSVVICCHLSVIRGPMIHQWHQIDWDQKQTENHYDIAAIEAGLIIIADQLWEIYIRGKQDHILWMECTSIRTWRCEKNSSLFFTLLIHKVLKGLCTNKVGNWEKYCSVTRLQVSRCIRCRVTGDQCWTLEVWLWHEPRKTFITIYRKQNNL